MKAESATKKAKTPKTTKKTPARTTKGCGRKPAQKKKRAVTLTLKGQPGQEVFLAGTFNDWCPDSLPMEEKKKGVYSVKLELETGLYEYKFIVNDVWTPDPDPSRDWTQNALGTLNSLLRVE